MSSNPKAVAAVFEVPERAQRAIEDLKSAGFDESQIGVAIKDAQAGREVSSESGVQVVGENTAAGLVTGGLVGMFVGLLATFSTLTIPGAGLILGGGFLANALAGAGIGAATGGFLGVLTGFGVAEEEAAFVHAGFEKGGTVVIVQGARLDEAREILVRDRGALADPTKAGRVDVL